MANHKSADKRNRQNAVKKDRNRGIRSKMRKAIKDARAAFASGENKDEALKTAIREVARARSRNVLKPNTAARYVSRLTRAHRG